MNKWLLILFFFPQITQAQWHDNTWIFGYLNDTILDNEVGIQILTFPEGNLKIEQNTQLERFNFWETNTSFSDSAGNVLSYSNAVHIGNKNWEIMEGGEYLTEAFEAGGELHSQWVLILPWPAHPDKQIALYERDSFTSALSVHATHLYSVSIDMSKQGGLGEVTNRDALLIQDTLAIGKICAVKHANGRDWWVMINEWNTNRFYSILVDTSGVQVVGSQTIGLNVIEGVGQAVFSPDGKHFGIYSTISTTQGAYIDLYDFDRCEGLLSNHRQYHFINNGWGGVAFSPNSRYLYLNYFTQAFQYDLEAPDVWASRIKIAEFDGYLDPFHTTFYLMQLAPDGKIYSSSTNSVSSLHVIHNPDELGLACEYQQHGIELPTYNAFSMPTFPNYRLGPLDGSSCDTLGLNNLPISWWRAEQDTLEPLQVYFHDLSYYEPNEWEWDFGDPASGGNNHSTERHPQHLFSTAGTYQVCLRVANLNARDTLCRTLTLGNTLAESPEVQARIQVSPNPFQSVLSVALSSPLLQGGVFHLFDQTGRLVLQASLSFGITDLHTGNLPSGLYFYRIEARGEVVKTGKVVKI